MPSEAAPILKWAGGKRQLLDAIYARFPDDYDTYHEPFLGGGAVFFDLEPDQATINDVNPRLINFYRQVRDRPEALIDRLHGFDGRESEPDPNLEYAETTARDASVDEYYYQQRARFNRRAYADEPFPSTERERLEEAALLLYLNRTGFNGLYRENNQGGFNVPKGRYDNPDWVQADRIRAAAPVLADADLRNEDFAYVREAATVGDLVYFDPPYEPESATADFTAYDADGFDRDDQLRLLRVARDLGARGVHVIVSNSGVMYDRYDSAGFTVSHTGAARSINSDPDGREEVDEIIATTVPPEEWAAPATAEAMGWSA